MSQEPKSSIFTPDPYYIPGYEGFFPQLRYQLGNTYGTTTSRLLTDPSIMKSPHSLLSPLRPPDTKTTGSPKLPRAQDGGFPVENEIVLPEIYIPPGYAGHRPMLQYQHATSFSRMVSNAVDEFTEMQTSVMRGQMKRPQERSTEDTFPRQWKPMAEYTSPLTSYSKNPQIDLSQRLQRKAITGYTGFIPRYCWTFGVGYRPGVKTSMDEFERMQIQIRPPHTQSSERRLKPTYWPQAKIYSPAGLVPRYTGFIPGFRDTYGATFGNSTRQLYITSPL